VIVRRTGRHNYTLDANISCVSKPMSQNFPGYSPRPIKQKKKQVLSTIVLMLDVITSTAALLALSSNGVTWLTPRIRAHAFPYCGTVSHPYFSSAHRGQRRYHVKMFLSTWNSFRDIHCCVEIREILWLTRNTLLWVMLSVRKGMQCMYRVAPPFPGSQFYRFLSLGTR
jgi:hypothetical protein